MPDKFSKFIGLLANITPATLAIVLTQWFGLFGDVGLAHIDFKTHIERLALAVSTTSVLAIYIWGHDLSLKALKICFTIVFVGGFVLSLLGCVYLNYHLGIVKNEQEIDITIEIWKWTYFFLLLSTSLCVIFFTLWRLRKHKVAR